MNKLTLDEQLNEEEAQDTLAVMKLIAQLNVLEERVRPLMRPASRKLITDLLGSGVTARAIGKVIGRSPSYVRTIVAKDGPALSTSLFLAVVRHAFMSGSNQR